MVTNAGGLPEIVDDGVSGKIVSPANSDELAVVTIDLLSKDEERLSMGEQARKKVSSDFSEDAMLKNISFIYEDLVSSGRAE